MKRIFSIMFLLVLLTFISVKSQTVVQVPPDVESGTFGALNDAFAANGTDAIYQLQTGTYLMNGRITTTGGHLQIIGPAEGKPAVIEPGLRDDGTVDGFIFDISGDMTLKNCWVLSWTEGDATQWTNIRYQADNSTVIIDNCIFEWNQGPAIEANGANISFYVTNSTFRNMIDPNQWWAGRMIYIINSTGCDSIVVENCSFVNMGFVWQCQQRFCNYFWWNHNTSVNCAKFSLQQELFTEAYITNNIWVNQHFTGERNVDRPGQDPDLLLWGAVLIVDTLNPATSLFAEEDRKIAFWWNNNYLDPAFTAFYDAYNAVDTVTDPILAEPFPGNERTMDMFNWHPMMKMGGVYDNEDPGFVAPSDNTALMIDFLNNRYSPAPAAVNWGWDPDDSNPNLSPQRETVYPLPENLAYTNTTLLTGGYGGFPLGDLRWFPDQLTAWAAQADAERAAIQQIPLSVKEVGGPVPTEFALKNAYPNPFNPSTNIEFVVGATSNIQLAIYNTVGQKIRTLYSGQLPAGTYNADWDGKDANGVSVSSGIYFYQLKAGSNFVETKKMMLMK